MGLGAKLNSLSRVVSHAKRDVGEVGNVNKIFINEKGLKFGELCCKEKLQQLGIKPPEFVYEYMENGNANNSINCFNYLKGNSVKKGNFEIFSYMDGDKLLGRETIYRDKGIRIVKQFRNHGDEKLIDTKIYSLEGTLLESSYQNLEKDTNNTWLSVKEIVSQNAEPDVHIIEKLQAKKSKQQVKYTFDWNNDTCANIPVTTNQPERFREFLPIMVSRSRENRKKLANYIGRIEERNLGISGLTSKPIKFKNLEPDTNGMNISGTGEILLNKRYLNNMHSDDYNMDLLETVSHEMQHRYDNSNLVRMIDRIVDFNFLSEEEKIKMDIMYPGCREFVKNSAKRGIIHNNDPLYPLLKQIDKELDNYELLCKTMGHDNLMVEQRAIQYAKRETDTYADCCLNLFEYLNFT